MDLALYDPQFGYYARAARRSGRTGDFFTSVDVGALFGELLETQIAEMAAILNSQFLILDFDLVEAGASSGRLAADILRAARTRHPDLYARTSLHLVEASARARAEHRSVLGENAARLVSSGPQLPESFAGVLIANDLLDALPLHQVVMREDGLPAHHRRRRVGRRRRAVDQPARRTGHDGSRGLHDRPHGCGSRRAHYARTAGPNLFSARAC